MASDRVSHRTFHGLSTLIFALSTMVTVVWCQSMAAMGGMPMPGGWTMTMAWMRMPDQAWSAVAASFIGMWVVMMVAMMLPSLVPMLRCYREAVGRSGPTRLGLLTALVASGYFSVWIGLGVAVFPIGLAVAAIEMQQPALARMAPIATAAVIFFAGWFQLSNTKRCSLVRCRGEHVHGPAVRADVTSAWYHGLRLGLDCVRCCGNLMLILLVAGVMDLRVMAAVTAAITVERLLPAEDRVAVTIGVLMLATAAVLLANVARVG